MKGCGKRVLHPVDGDLAFLHGLEQAAWVLGGVRLISSASRMLVKTGPGRKPELVPLQGQRAG